MRILRFGCIGWCVLLMGCGGSTQPQRPIVHGQQSRDTAAIELITMHQQMAARADVALAQRVTSDYVLMDENYWVKGLRDAGENALKQDEYIKLKAQFFSMDDRLLTTHEATVQVGRVDEIQAIVYVLPHLHRDMQITMLVPWYLAFGCVGNADVPEYENLRIELQVQ